MLLRTRGPVFAPEGAASGSEGEGGTVVDPAVAGGEVIDPSTAGGGDPDPTPAADPKPRAADPLISTITGLRAEKRGLVERAERAEREAADARALADRLAAGGKADPATAIPRAAAPAGDDGEVDRRADYKLFVRDVASMKEAGLQAFGAPFNDAIRVLDAVGAADDGFIQQVMAVDPKNAHVLLNQIAQDPERAVSLVGMDPIKRTAELTRMSMATSAAPAVDPKPAPTPAPAAKPAAPAARGVSRAPAPAPTIDPSASKVVDWRADEATDEQFDAGFKDMMAKRSARR